jgi:phage/plasmid-associated DNA primase
MKVLDNIFDGYIAHVDMLDLQKDGFSKTALVDKLANSFSEISKMKQKDVGVFKAIASGDRQSVNSKYKDRFDSVIKLIQFYSSNQMPEIEEVNEGFIRRAHPIEFNQRILKKDPYIDDKLNEPEERKRVLALLIRIARITRDHGFLFEKTYKEKENILLKKTSPINEFLQSRIVFKRDGYRIKKKDLYRLYCDYCDANQFQPQGTIAFSKFLTNAGFKYGGRNEDPYWEGLGVPPISEGQKVLSGGFADE